MLFLYFILITNDCNNLSEIQTFFQIPPGFYYIDKNTTLPIIRASWGSGSFPQLANKLLHNILMKKNSICCLQKHLFHESFICKISEKSISKYKYVNFA